MPASAEAWGVSELVVRGQHGCGPMPPPRHGGYPSLWSEDDMVVVRGLRRGMGGIRACGPRTTWLWSEASAEAWGVSELVVRGRHGCGPRPPPRHGGYPSLWSEDNMVVVRGLRRGMGWLHRGATWRPRRLPPALGSLQPAKNADIHPRFTGRRRPGPERLPRPWFLRRVSPAVTASGWLAAAPARGARSTTRRCRSLRNRSSTSPDGADAFAVLGVAFPARRDRVASLPRDAGSITPIGMRDRPGRFARR